mgnify:FL=1
MTFIISDYIIDFVINLNQKIMALNKYTESQEKELNKLIDEMFLDNTDIENVTKKISDIIQQSSNDAREHYRNAEIKLNNLINK